MKWFLPHGITSLISNVHVIIKPSISERPSARPPSGSPWRQLWWPWAAESRYLAETWTTWRSTAAVSHTACWDCWAGDGEHRTGCCRNLRTQPLVRCFPGYWWSAGRAAPHGCPVWKTWRSRLECHWTWPSGTGTSGTGPNPRLSRPQNASASFLCHEYKAWLDLMTNTTICVHSTHFISSTYAKFTIWVVKLLKPAFKQRSSILLLAKGPC